MASKSSQAGTYTLEDDLKEIIQSNKDILELLDKIEAQQKQQNANKEKCTDKRKEELILESVKQGHDIVPDRCVELNQDKEDDEKSDVNYNATKTSETELSMIEDGNRNITEQTVQNHDLLPKAGKDENITLETVNRQATGCKDITEHRLEFDPKHGQNYLGNLSIIQRKFINIEEDPGFVERIKLTEEQKVFSKSVKARKTLIQQDNRICVYFGLPLINKGHVYESIRKPSSAENPKPVTDLMIKVDQNKVEVDRKKQQDEHERSKLLSRSSSKQEQKQPLKSILKKTNSSSNPKSILENPDATRRPVEERLNEKKAAVREPKTVVQSGKQDISKDAERSNRNRSNNNGQDPIQLIQATDVLTDQGRSLMKMQAHMLRMQAVTLMPEKKVALHTCADMMDKMAGANENIRNPKFWSKLSDDISEEQKVALLEYLEELQSLFYDHLQLDQNLKGLFKGSLFLIKAVAEGNLLEKHMSIGEYVEQHSEEISDKSTNVMRAYGEIADSESRQQPSNVMMACGDTADSESRQQLSNVTRAYGDTADSESRQQLSNVMRAYGDTADSESGQQPSNVMRAYGDTADSGSRQQLSNVTRAYGEIADSESRQQLSNVMRAYGDTADSESRQQPSNVTRAYGDTVDSESRQQLSNVMRAYGEIADSESRQQPSNVTRAYGDTADSGSRQQLSNVTRAYGDTADSESRQQLSNVMRAYGDTADSESRQEPSATFEHKQPLALTDRVEQEPAPVITEKTEKVILEKVEEHVTMNEGLWAEYANEEVKKGQISKDIREKGMDTIFCLDVSQSMRGEPLRQAKSFIRGFVEGIQNTNLGNDVFEHVSLVTFGSETKVQQHLTCDYFELLRKLDRLQPGGPTPMFAGLTMTWAAILGAGTVFMSNGYKMYPRVYILSDGKVTPAAFIGGPDSCTEEESAIEQAKVTKQAIHLHKEYHLTIHAVPLGDFDMNTSESITKQTGGKIIAPEDWKSECKSFRNYLKACRFGQSSQLHKLLGEMLPVDPVDQAQIDEFLKTHKHEGGGKDSDEESPGFENGVFPPLGSRVKKKGENLYGTVTKHFRNGFGVTWDTVDADGTLRVRFTDLDDVEQVDKPRVLTNELIAVGCKVKRGEDWSYGDQDGTPGNEGTVFDVQTQGLVLVRWDHDGSMGSYKYGLDGRFDLEIVQPERKSAPKHNVIEKRNEINIEELNRRNKQGSGFGLNVVSVVLFKWKGAESNKEFKWAWQDRDGKWRTFPGSVCKTIETSYKRNPRGTVLITFEDKQYRIVFSRMEQTDINTKDKLKVSRS